MRHLVQDAARTVVVIISAGGGILREAPEPVVRAGHDGVVAWDGVEQRTAVGTVTVDVGAGDLRRRGLHALDVGVDGANLGLLRSGLEPGGEEISAGACCGVGSGGKGDGVRNASLQRAGLGSAARVVGDGALPNPGGNGCLALGDVVPGR